MTGGGRPAIDLDMRESVLLSHVRAIAALRGWLIYHTHRSDRSDPGWPDLVLVHPVARRLLIVELKRTRGRVTGPQQQWLDALRACGVDARLWRPADLASGEIADALNPHRPPRPSEGSPS